MSVHKTATGRWEVRWREGSRNRSRTVDRKSDAVRLDAEIRRQRQLGGLIPDRVGGLTLEEFAADWLSGRSDLARRTKELYTFLLDHHIMDDLGHFPLNELRPKVLGDWKERRLAQGAGPVTLSKAATLLKQVLDEAVAQEHLQRNPASGLKGHSGGKRPPNPATPEQIEAMRSHLIAKDYLGDATLVSVLGYAGLRPGEALALRWSDIEDGTISVTKAIAYGEEKKTKTGMTRVVRPPSAVFSDLAEWKLSTPLPFGLVFPRRVDGKAWTRTDWNNWRRRRFQPAIKAAGLEKFRPYDLRHSRASMLAYEAKNLSDLFRAAKEMGHTKDVFLRVYAHIIEQAEGKYLSADAWIAEARSKVRSDNVRRAG